MHDACMSYLYYKAGSDKGAKMNTQKISPDKITTGHRIVTFEDGYNGACRAAYPIAHVQQTETHALITYIKAGVELTLRQPHWLSMWVTS